MRLFLGIWFSLCCFAADAQPWPAKPVRMVVAYPPGGGIDILARQLADKLASRKLSQLRQRISLLNGLSPLSIEQSCAYIDHRLRVAGYSGGPLFDHGAINVIAQFTEGIPRNINNFCFGALSLGCALGQRVIGLSVVEEVISDLDITKHVTEVASVAPLDYGTAAAAGNGNFAPFPPQASEPGSTLTPAEAKAYMQQLAVQLRDWKRNLDRTELLRHGIRVRHH